MSPRRVPQIAVLAWVQVVRRPDDARVRAGRHRHRRAERLGQVERRRRRRLGARRPGPSRRAVLEDGRRHLRRHLEAPGPRAGRGVAHDRQRLRPPAGRLGRGDDHPDAVPHRRERVLDERRPPAASSTSRSCSRTPASAASSTSSWARASSTPSCRRRPEDRRAVIEEAAGILKFRRRRERAERRIESTEANLLRLQDLHREVRRQLRPLERQAEAARRHDSLASELRALRLFLAGKELTSLKKRLSEAEAHTGSPSESRRAG